MQIMCVAAGVGVVGCTGARAPVLQAPRAGSESPARRCSPGNRPRTAADRAPRLQPLLPRDVAEEATRPAGRVLAWTETSAEDDGGTERPEVSDHVADLPVGGLQITESAGMLHSEDLQSHTLPRAERPAAADHQRERLRVDSIRPAGVDPIPDEGHT